MKNYDHDPASEKHLFRDVLNAYSFENPDQDYIRGIEIGVLNGETSRFLLSLDPRIGLIGIDPLIPDSMENSLIGSYTKIRKNTQEFRARFAFFKAYSHDVHEMFDDECCDFIFVDGDHTFEAVKRDHDLYLPKLKNGGYMFFHDSRMFRGGAPFHEGSSKFVESVITNSNKLDICGEAFSLTCFRKL